LPLLNKLGARKKEKGKEIRRQREKTLLMMKKKNADLWKERLLRIADW